MKTWELQPKLTLTERPSQEVGPLDVKVRVKAVSLNYRDVLIARSAKQPRVPVSDGAGEVIAVGDKVTKWKVGDRVMGSFFPSWVDGELSDAHHAIALGGGSDGMLREEVVLPEHSWVRAPKGWSFEEAATLPCAGLTAWQALFEVAEVKPGNTVLVQGSGGVSVFALQLARKAGARVIATSSSAEKAKSLREMGASDVIDYRAEPKWGEKVKELTHGHGVDVVVEVGGAATFDQSVQALRYGGTMSIIGVLTGGRGEVNLHAMFAKRQRVHGVYVGSTSMFDRFVAALEETGIRPMIDQTFEFAKAPEAYEHLASAQHFGKVVIRVG
ncbi:MAG: zinc-dependent alcohol dehydrogenase family protein [Archangium sp.]